jgi:hypothetical protein
LLPPDRFVDATAVPLQADEIDHVTVRLDGETLDVIRDGADFRLLSRDSQIISRPAGTEFFEAIADAKLRLIEKSDEFGDSVGKILVRGQSALTAATPPVRSAPTPRSAHAPSSDGVREVSLNVFRKPDESLVLERLDDGVFLEVPMESRWAFQADDAWAKDRELSQFSAADVTRVQIEFPEGETTGTVRNAEGFSLLPSESEPADAILTRALFDEVAHIEAKRFLSPSKPRPASGLLVVRFSVQKSPREAAIEDTLWIGERTQGGYLAWSSLTDGAFVLPLHSRIVYETPLMDRSSLHIEPDDLSSITIGQDDRSYAFERQGGVFRASGGRARDEMAPTLQEALRLISVVAAVPQRDYATWSRLKDPLVTIEGTPKDSSEAPFVLFIGRPGVWQGQSVRTMWKKGDPRIYLVNAASLQDLLELL